MTFDPQAARARCEAAEAKSSKWEDAALELEQRWRSAERENAALRTACEQAANAIELTTKAGYIESHALVAAHGLLCKALSKEPTDAAN